MSQDYYSMLHALRLNHSSLVLATVIAVRGSSSAKPGAKAILSADGRNLWGWVGGGCAERFIIEQSLETLTEKRPRVVTVDLDDELLGVGMPCGGFMDVYLEPLLPRPGLTILGDSETARQLAALADWADFAVTVRAPDIDQASYPFAETVIDGPWRDRDVTEEAVVFLMDAEAAEIAALEAAVHGVVIADTTRVQSSVDGVRRAVSLLATLLAKLRATNGHALSIEADRTRTKLASPSPTLSIVGQGRIAEALAKLASLLSWPTTVNSPLARARDYPGGTRIISNDIDLELTEIDSDTLVVVASQHKGDHEAASTAIRRGAPYIGLIASRKRAGLVLEYLDELGLTERPMLHAPAGLDLAAVTPFEIALSIISQILNFWDPK
jgi:xanthine dehydrogenase accessory factor